MTQKQACFSILKVLLRVGIASIYAIEQALPKNEKMVRTTITRHVKELERKKMLKIKKGPRKADNCSLTFKGLYFLFVEKQLEDKDLQTGTWKLFEEVGFSKNQFLKQQIFVRAVRTAIEDSVKTVNLEYFDEQHVRQFLYRSLQQQLTLLSDAQTKAEMIKLLLSRNGEQYKNELMNTAKSLRIDNKRVIKTLEKENKQLSGLIGNLKDRNFRQRIRSLV